MPPRQLWRTAVISQHHLASANWLCLALAYALKLDLKSTYYWKVIRVDFETLIDPVLLNTFPTRYQHMVYLLPDKYKTRKKYRTLQEMQDCGEHCLCKIKQ